MPHNPRVLLYFFYWNKNLADLVLLIFNSENSYIGIHTKWMSKNMITFRAESCVMNSRVGSYWFPWGKLVYHPIIPSMSGKYQDQTVHSGKRSGFSYTVCTRCVCFREFQGCMSKGWHHLCWLSKFAYYASSLTDNLLGIHLMNRTSLRNE